jgi:hypothetical protein
MSYETNENVEYVETKDGGLYTVPGDVGCVEGSFVICNDMVVREVLGYRDEAAVVTGFVFIPIAASFKTLMVMAAAIAANSEAEVDPTYKTSQIIIAKCSETLH